MSKKSLIQAGGKEIHQRKGILHQRKIGQKNAADQGTAQRILSKEEKMRNIDPKEVAQKNNQKRDHIKTDPTAEQRQEVGVKREVGVKQEV